MGKNRKKSKGLPSPEAPVDEKPSSEGAKIPAPAKKTLTASERQKLRVEGLKKTLVPAILGAGLGFVSFYLLGDGIGPFSIMGESLKLEWHFFLLNFFLLTLLLQRPVYPLLGINVLEFKAKDWIYVEFIALVLWLFTWTMLLN